MTSPSDDTASGGSSASLPVAAAEGDIGPRPSPRRQLSGLANRAGLNIADQIVSSGTNLALSLLVARALSADGFGAFSIAFTIYSLLISTGRSLLSQPLQVRHTSQGPQAYRDAARAAAGGSLLLGLGALVVCVVTGLVLGGTLGDSLLVIGVFLPGLLLQDMWRMIFIGDGKPGAALLNDCVWGVIQFAAVAALILTDHRSAPSMEAGWAGAAAVAALVGIAQFRARPLVRAAIPWLAQHRDLLGYYFMSFLTTLGSGYLTLLCIGAIGSPADVGAIRASQVVLGPLNLAAYSLQAFALPEVARRQLKGRSAIKAGLALSALMTSVGLVGSAVLLLIPDHLGRELLGQSWSNAQDVLPWTILGTLSTNLGFGGAVVMTARGFAKDAFWVTAPLAPGYIVLGLLGLHLGGAPGAAAGMALCQLLITPLAWGRLIQLLRREQRTATSGEGSGGSPASARRPQASAPGR